MIARFRTLALLAALAPWAFPASAQPYPVKPIRMVVPVPAGGAADIAARIVTQPLSQVLGQTIIVDNKGGFAYAHWDGTTETEVEIKEKTKATIRCIPLGWPEETGACILTGKPSAQRVLFAKAY